MPARRGDKSKTAAGRKPSTSALSVRRAGRSNDFELVHPRAAVERAADIEEVEHMLDAGEVELAKDELRWLLDDCRELLDAHRLLGELALLEADTKLARAHFGYAYKLGIDALPGSLGGELPYRLGPNQGFFQAGKGLAACLVELGESAMARDVLQRLVALDPTDPLALADILSQLPPRVSPGA